jgi:iron complex outermembrane receptor protein
LFASMALADLIDLDRDAGKGKTPMDLNVAATLSRLSDENKDVGGSMLDVRPFDGLLPAALIAAASMMAPATARAAAQDASGAQIEAGTTVAPITVVANTPLPGASIDADKLAGEVQTLSIPQLTRDRRDDVIANLVNGQLASVSLNDEQGNPFQPDFTFRGFEASPISGIAEGLAVYQDGVRLNESFGDNVNWDLIPEFAVKSLTVQSNNPVFGLNALGGAATLEMKDGLTSPGLAAEVSGGSFGNVAGHVEYGARLGDVAVYLAAGGLHDDGFRYQSPTTLRQAYGDLAYQHDALTLHLSASAALNDIGAVGPTPVELLAQNPKSVFTYPQSMRNQAELVQLRGAYRVNDGLSLSANAYYRRFEQHLVDGNTTDVQACENDASQFCLEGAGDFPGDALYDSHGNTVPTSVLANGATPGETDFTHTRTDSFGGALQASFTAPVAGHGDNLVFGVSADQGITRYEAYGELGTLQDNLDVVGSGVVIDQGLSATAQPPIETPVDVKAKNTYVGVYGIDVFDITPKLSLTLSGRWNYAGISLRDETAGDPTGGDLNADHNFSRFNPGVGLAYKLSDPLTVYAGYSESNRAPTAGELSCANPSSPCLLDAFLVSDPNLKQVVSHNIEAGVRGRFDTGHSGGRVTWNISAYRTQNDNDILLVATEINGFGYFQNAGATLRQGVDMAFGYRDQRISFKASYTYLDATFRSAEALSSNSPSADADGLIYVHPGDRLPMIPANRLTFSSDYDVTAVWSVGADLRWQSGQYLVGDESNQQPQLPGFTTASLRTVYTITRRLEMFGEIENLFDARYYTYGAFTDLGGLPPSFNLSNPRTYSPSQGRAFTVGARLNF